MFEIDSIKGVWSTDKPVVVMTACDHEYYDQFFERWREGFARWPVHLHVHVIDVPPQKLPSQGAGITVTHERTVDWDWTGMKRRYDHLPIPKWKKYKATYEWYCQSIRYYILSRLLETCGSVVVTDVDAVALRIPEPQQLADLTKHTQFNISNGRLYANFCNIHSDDLALARQLAQEIKTGCLAGDKSGNDQVAMKKIFTQPRSMSQCWTDQEDINDPAVVERKMQKIVFHAKGTRGKNFSLPTSRKS